MVDRREKVLGELKRATKSLKAAIDADSSDEGDEKNLFIPDSKYPQLMDIYEKLILLLYFLETISYPRR